MRFREIINEENVNYESMIQSFVRLFNRHDIPLKTHYLNDNPDGTKRPWTLNNASPRTEMAPVIALRKQLSLAKTFLKRKDRVIWYMRIARIKVIYDIVQNENYHSAGSYDKSKVLIAMENVLDEALRDYQHATGHEFPKQRNLELGGKLSEPTIYFPNENRLTHFAALDGISPEVEAIRWTNQTPSDLFAQLRAAESIWHDRMREKNVMFSHR